MSKLTIVSAVVIVAVGLTISVAQEPAATPASRLITIGKTTTHIDGPLDEAGYVDYLAALNKMFSKGVTPKNNAAVPIFQAFGRSELSPEILDEFFQQLGISVPPKEGRYYISLEDFAIEEQAVLAGDQPGDREQKTRQAATKEYGLGLAGPWTREQHPQLARWLERNEMTFQKAHEASRCSRFYTPYVVADGQKGPALIAILLPGAIHARTLARLLAIRGHLFVGEGQSQQARDQFLAIHRLARLSSQGATVLEGLVGFAMDGIATAGVGTVIEHGQLTDEELLDFQQQLAKLPRTASIIDKIDTVERFIFLSTVQSISRNGMQVFQQLNERKMPAPGVLFGEGALQTMVDWNVVMRMANEWYDKFAEIGERKDLKERRELLAAIDQELAEIIQQSRSVGSLAREVLLSGKSIRQITSERMAGILISMMVPGVSKAVLAEDKSVMLSEMGQVAIAIARFERTNGHYPDRLAELKPQFVTRIPTDIYSEESILYLRRDDGYFVYSVGRDRKDNKGDSFDTKPVADDVVIRVTPEDSDRE
jgi:PII-like signaling protein